MNTREVDVEARISNVLEEVPLSPDQFMIRLNDLRQNQPFIHSRFNSKLVRGELGPEELAEYAIYNYNQGVQFPRNISAELAGCPDLAGRRRLAVQILEEVGANVLASEPAYRYSTKWDSRPHDELAKMFALEVGVPEEHLATPTKEARRWMDLRYRLSCRHWLIGCAINNFMTEKSLAESRPVWIKSLQEFYRIRSNRALAFHKLHAWVDLRHASIGIDLLREHATGEEDQVMILKALPKYFKLALETFNSFLKD